MEGATFYFVRSLDALQAMNISAHEFIATGGGAKSDVWLQIKADIMGVPFVRPRITECGALGAAILAGIGVGLYRDEQEAFESVYRPGQVYEPDLRLAEQYAARFAVFEQIYPALRGINGRLLELG